MLHKTRAFDCLVDGCVNDNINVCLLSLFAFTLFQGGISFVVVKGVVRIYYKQQQYVRQAQRVVKDYDQE